MVRGTIPTYHYLTSFQPLTVGRSNHTTPPYHASSFSASAKQDEKGGTSLQSQENWSPRSVYQSSEELSIYDPVKKGSWLQTAKPVKTITNSTNVATFWPASNLWGLHWNIEFQIVFSQNQHGQHRTLSCSIPPLQKKPGFCEYRLDHGGGWEALICATAQIWNKYHGQDVVKWNCVLTENHCSVFCNGLQHLISRRIKFKLMDVHLKGRQFKQHWVVAGVSHAPTNLHTASVHKEVLVSTTKKGILTTGHRVCKDFFHLNNQRQGKERTLIWDDHTQDDELHMRFLSMCGYNALPWSCDSRTMIQIQFVSHYFRIFCPSWNAVFMSILWTCWVSYC